MKPITLFFIFLTCHALCQGQMSDSLYNTLPELIRPKNRMAITDDERLALIGGIPARDVNTNQKEVYEIIAEADKRAATTTNKSIKVNFTLQIAGFYVNTNQYPKAREYYVKVMQYANGDTAYNKQIAEAATQLAALYSLQTQTDSAMNYLRTALDAGDKKDTFFMLRMYAAYRVIYTQLNLYEQAIDYGKKFINMVPELYRWYQDYNSAYYQVGNLYANFFRDTKQHKYADSANYYARQIIANTKDDLQYWYSGCYCLLGRVKLMENKYAEAIPLFDTCLLPQYIDSNIAASDLRTIAKLNRAVCQLKSGTDKTAALEMMDTLTIPRRSFFLLQLKYQTLYENANDEGSWNAALAYYKKYIEFSDSIGIINNRSKVFEANQKYSVAEKQAIIKDLENKNLLQEKQQNEIESIAAIASLLLLLAVILVYTIFKRKQLKEAKEKQKLSETLNKVEKDFNNERIALQEEQIKQIREQRYQISTDIHDGINSGLAAVRFYVADLKQSSHDKKTESLLQDIESELESLYLQARDFLRKLSTEKVDTSYFVTHLLEGLKEKFDTISIIKINTSYSEKELDNRLTPAQQKQLCLVIQEAVTNIIKYADAETANIRISTDDTNNCSFIIQDDGKGFDKTATVKGLGLKSMEKRMAELNGELRIASNKSGTIIQGQFPLI